jgi:hypothetical protein
LLRALSSGFVRATPQDNPSMTAGKIRAIVTGGEGQTLEFKGQPRRYRAP